MCFFVGFVVVVVVVMYFVALILLTNFSFHTHVDRVSDIPKHCVTLKSMLPAYLTPMRIQLSRRLDLGLTDKIAQDRQVARAAQALKYDVTMFAVKREHRRKIQHARCVMKSWMCLVLKASVSSAFLSMRLHPPPRPPSSSDDDDDADDDGDGMTPTDTSGTDPSRTKRNGDEEEYLGGNDTSDSTRRKCNVLTRCNIKKVLRIIQ